MELPFEVPAGVELVADLSTTDWIQPRLLPQERSLGVRVGEIIPTGFDAYARVFHPAREGDAMEPRRWSELAERNERVVHPEMQLEHIVGSLDISSVPGLESPLEGDLPGEQLEALINVLRTFTATPSVCWFAVWEGYGFYGGGVSLLWSPDEDPAIVRARERAEVERARRAARQSTQFPLPPEARKPPNRSEALVVLGDCCRHHPDRGGGRSDPTASNRRSCADAVGHNATDDMPAATVVFSSLGGVSVAVRTCRFARSLRAATTVE